MSNNELVLLTKKQYHTLVAIHTHARQHGTAPTLDELAHRLGLAGAAGAHFRVRTLVRLGWVTTAHTPTDPPPQRQNAPTHTPSRTLRLTPQGEIHFARLRRLYSSTLLCGERDLILGPTEFALAQQINLPLATLTVRTKQNRHILRFPTPAERNFWADQLLQHLPNGQPSL